MIILNLAIPGSKSLTLIYQKTSDDICLAGVFATGQVSQHLYLFLGMVDPELKTSTKPLVFSIVFFMFRSFYCFIHLQMNQVFTVFFLCFVLVCSTKYNSVNLLLFFTHKY